MAYINPDDFPKTSNVGTAGQVLTSNGVGVPASFQDPAGGGGFSLGYNSGKYYLTTNPAANGAAGQVIVANELWISPWLVTENLTIDRISINVQSASGGGTRVRLGLYNVSNYNVSNGQPTTVAHDFGTVTTDATGQREITISQALTAGYYFVAAHFESTPTIIRQNIGAASNLLHQGTVQVNFGYNGWSYSSAFGSGFPDLTSSTPTNQFYALLTWVRKA